MQNLFSKIVEGEIPEDWKNSVSVPIYKEMRCIEVLKVWGY